MEVPRIESTSLDDFLVDLAGKGLTPARQAAGVLLWHESRARGATMTGSEIATVLRTHGLGNRKPKVLLGQLKALRVTMSDGTKGVRLLTARIRDVAEWVGYDFGTAATTRASAGDRAPVAAPRGRGRKKGTSAKNGKDSKRTSGAADAKPRLFIGSSVEGLDIARAIESNLQHDCEGTVWTSGVFGPNRAPLETLLKECELADFAVVVLTPDDVVTKRDAKIPVARDNCIFELGLFMGQLGRDRAFYVHERNIKLGLPSDLDGLVTLKYAARSDGNWDAALSPASTDVRKAIRKHGKRGA